MAGGANAGPGKAAADRECRVGRYADSPLDTNPMPVADIGFFPDKTSATTTRPETECKCA